MVGGTEKKVKKRGDERGISFGKFLEKRTKPTE